MARPLPWGTSRPMSPDEQTPMLEKAEAGGRSPSPAPPEPIALNRYRISRRLRHVLAGFALLGVVLLLFSGFFASTAFEGSDDDDEPMQDPSSYHGKTLAPSNITVITGLFRQDDPDLDEDGYDMLQDNFGLLDKSSGRWRKFTKHIADLNRKADAHTTYKVIYIARHGQGYHNLAESTYGTAAWNCHWSMLNTDGNLTWGPDALLTPLGEKQVAAAKAGWKKEAKDGVPLPQAFYSSPLRRAATTLDITWHELLKKKGLKPMIKENWREIIGLHTCDLRSSKSVLAETYTHYTFEPSFTEHDPYWDPVYQETDTQQAVRIRMELNDLFATDPRTFISITCHGGVIGAFFKATGHRPFKVQTGGFVPVVLKAVSYPSATFSPITRGQSATAPACTTDMGYKSKGIVATATPVATLP